MAKLLEFLFRPLVITLLALGLVSVLILIGGPYVADKIKWTVDGSSFYTAVFVLWLVAGLVFGWRRLQARKRAQVIADRLRLQAKEQVAQVRPDRQPEIEALEKQFDEALAALQGTRMGKRALYALPWYVIVGPPGSGKTTLLKESNLDFPHQAHGGRGVRGVGGTRNCDWWFTADAILLDTAGRYTTEAEDHDEWLAFLEMLGKARPREPINGALVAISVQDVVGAREDELAEHCERIRARLGELSQELDMVFPVYLVFTKCDLIDGFVETFGAMTREERSQVWGVTLTPEIVGDRSRGDVVAEHLKALRERLVDRRLALLGTDRPSGKRNRIYSFPLQFEAIRARVEEFTRFLVQPNPYAESPELRGVYFTSGTQEGAPIDRVLSAMGQAFGLDAAPQPAGGEQQTAKSYFIDDLFTDVVFRDRDLARRSEKLLKQQHLARKIGLYGSAAAAALMLIWMIVGYFSNSSIIGDTRRLLQKSVDKIHALKSPAGAAEPEIRIGSDDEARQLMAELARTFSARDDAASGWGNKLLGRDRELVELLRDQYVQFLRLAFLNPIQDWLVAELARDRAREDPTRNNEQLVTLNHRVTVLKALVRSGTEVDARALREAIVGQNLWNWSTEQIGRTPLAGAEGGEHEHLEVFLTRICTSVSDAWRSRQHIAELDKAVRFQRDKSGPEKVAAQLFGDDTEDKVGVGKLFQGDKVPKHIDKNAKVPEALTVEPDVGLRRYFERLKAFGERIDKERKGELEATFRKNDLRSMRRQISTFRLPEQSKSSLRAVQVALGDQRQPGSALRSLKDKYRGRLEAHGDSGSVALLEGDWFKSLNAEIGKVEDAVKTFLNTWTGSGIGAVHDGKRNQTARLQALLSALKTSWDDVEGIADGASKPVAMPFLVLARNLISDVRHALGRDLAAELKSYWADTSKLLVDMRKRFPFAPAAEEEVSPPVFANMFRHGGQFAEKYKLIGDLMEVLRTSTGDIGLDPAFVRDLANLETLRAAMFATPDAQEISLQLKVGLHLASDDAIGRWEIHASDKVSLDSVFAQASRASRPIVWEQGQSGSKILVRYNIDRKLPPFELKKYDKSAWGLLRLIQAGKPKQIQGSAQKFQCTWEVENEKTTYRFLADFTVERSANPIIPNLFEKFEFPADVITVGTPSEVATK